MERIPTTDLQAMRERCQELPPDKDVTDGDHQCARCGGFVRVVEDHTWSRAYWCLDCLHGWWETSRLDLPRLLDALDAAYAELGELQAENERLRIEAKGQGA
jgi:hypothetical protein